MMKLEPAERKHLETLVSISKAAFDTDIAVGAPAVGGPPEYDSPAWHEQMLGEGHLFQATVDGQVVGGALLFSYDEGEGLFVGRIFIDPAHHRKGYGLSLMALIEAFDPRVRKLALDTPLWNVRTNAFYQKLGYEEYRRDAEFAYYQKNLR